jgi:hypothetical protein
MINVLNKRFAERIFLTHHNFTKEKVHISLVCSMDAVMEIGYEIGKRRKKEY